LRGCMHGRGLVNSKGKKILEGRGENGGEKTFKGQNTWKKTDTPPGEGRSRTNSKTSSEGGRGGEILGPRNELWSAGVNPCRGCTRTVGRKGGGGGSPSSGKTRCRNAAGLKKKSPVEPSQGELEGGGLGPSAFKKGVG